MVTESNAEINGVGLVHRAGEILLCYVAPESQGHGYGSAILAALEGKARTWGLDKLRLGSTVSARPFYERHGYISAGESRAVLDRLVATLTKKICKLTPRLMPTRAKATRAGYRER